MNVNGYELTTDWAVSNRGYTAQATKGGKKYFLKKYNMYKIPKHDASTSEALYNRLKNQFDSFKDNRIRVNRALDDLSGEGGNIILPKHWFVDDIYYIEATPFVENLIEDEEILRLSADEKVFMMLTAAAAVYNIHKKKVIHSDLKRTNILAARNSSGKVAAKIIDFDMSYFEDDIRPDELGGDQNFMSPELAQCFMYDMADEALAYMTTKSDIFSLGLVFHDYLVTEDYTDSDGKHRTRGCHPKLKGLTGKLKERFDEGKTVYCCEALLAGAKLVVSDKIKDKYLRHLIAAMLQPEPENRPTAAEVRDALRNKTVLDLKSDSVLIEGEDVTPAPAPAPDPTPEPAPTEETRVPSGFCAPWSTHAITFNEDKLVSSGYVASEQADRSGNKCYYLYKRDGSKRLFTIETLLILGMASRTGGASEPPRPTPPGATSGTSSGTASAPEIKVYDDGKLWDEDAAYAFNMASVTGSGYKSAARAERKGLKGYVLIKHSGELRFMTVDKLKLLDFIVKK